MEYLFVRWLELLSVSLDTWWSNH